MTPILRNDVVYIMLSALLHATMSIKVNTMENTFIFVSVLDLKVDNEMYNVRAHIHVLSLDARQKRTQ